MPTFLYFTNSQRPNNIAPAISGGAFGWISGAQMTRWVMKPTKDNIVPTAGTTIDMAPASGNLVLDRQYISPGLAGGQPIIGVVSGQLMVREFANGDNVDRVFLCAKLVSNDGATVRGTLLNLANYGLTLEFLHTAMRNAHLATGQALTNSLTAEDGDRIVLEIGYQNSAAGTTPQAAGAWGGNAPNLPRDQTTTAGAGWFSLSGNLKFRRTEFIENSTDD